MTTAAEHAVVGRLRAAGCVFAEDEARLLVAAARTPGELDILVGRRESGKPLEHVLGWAEFSGLRVAVDEGVFVPRRRTELIVHEARAALARSSSHPVVVDLCCGSGAVGVAVASLAGPVDLHAADIDPVAVRCARRNVAAAGGEVYEGDLYEPLPRVLQGRVDVLIANAPYVPAAAIARMPPEARDHERRVALDGGADGLDVLRRVIAEAPAWLAPGGSVYVESGEPQAARVVTHMKRSGLEARIAVSAELAATVVVGSRRGW